MLEMFEIAVVMAVAFVALIWGCGVLARVLIRYGTYLGKTAAVRKREAALAHLDISPTEGGVLGDLSPVLAAEERHHEAWRHLQRSLWRNRWLPWRRLAAWRAGRKPPGWVRGGAVFWKSQRDEAMEDIEDLRAELTLAHAACNQLRREIAFLRGDKSADPQNGGVWPVPAVNGRNRSGIP